MPKVKVYKITQPTTSDGLFIIDNPDVLHHDLIKIADNVLVNFRTTDGIEHSKMCAAVRSLQWSISFFIPLELIEETDIINFPDAVPEQPKR